MIRKLGTMLALGTVALVLPSTVAATPPCECVLAGVIPVGGSIGVPTNARIFVPEGGFTATQVTLAPEMAPGEVVTVRVEPTGGTLNQSWIIPETELTPSTVYLLQLPFPPDTVRFTTGAGPDTTAPQFTSATVTGGELSGDCDDHLAAVATVEGLTDDVVPTDHILVRVVVDDPASDIEARTVWLEGPHGTFGAFSNPTWQTCMDNFPGVSAVRTWRAVVTAVDWSGNESSPSTTASFRFQENHDAAGCGCRATGAAAPSGLSLAALLSVCLLVLRGRRR
jgi:MYXO-CTERM domain-containing protein